MKKILSSIILGVFTFSNCYSQLENANWYFGDSAGIKFTKTGIETITNSPMRSLEASASISDTAGNLLMFTNGISVWNRLSNRMPNGFGLLGGPDAGPGFGSSTTNGVMILPYPNNQNLYCILTVYGFGDHFSDSVGLHYSIVDINSDGGLGDVNQKNIVLHDTALDERLCAIKHANGRDWWILVHKTKKSNEFIKFLFQPDGFHGPFYQRIGTYTKFFYGEMIANEQGDKVAIADYDSIKIFSFDRCNGQLINYLNLPHLMPQFSNLYGLSFSPNGKFIYTGISSFLFRQKLYQYKIDTPTKITENIIFDVGAFDTTKHYYTLNQHQIGPDGKIYICYSYGLPAKKNYFNQFLFSIDSPDVAGTGCHIHPNSVSLGTHINLGGLPNFPNYNLGKLIGSSCDTLFTFSSSHTNPSITRVFPNPSSDEITIEILNGVAPEEIKVLDVTGRVWKQLKPHQPVTQLNISQLPFGIYFLQIKTQSGGETRKFMKTSEY